MLHMVDRPQVYLIFSLSIRLSHIFTANVIVSPYISFQDFQTVASSRNPQLVYESSYRSVYRPLRIEVEAARRGEKGEGTFSQPSMNTTLSSHDSWPTNGSRSVQSLDEPEGQATATPHSQGNEQLHFLSLFSLFLLPPLSKLLTLLFSSVPYTLTYVSRGYTPAHYSIFLFDCSLPSFFIALCLCWGVSYLSSPLFTLPSSLSPLYSPLFTLHSLCSTLPPLVIVIKAQSVIDLLLHNINEDSECSSSSDSRFLSSLFYPLSTLLPPPSSFLSFLQSLSPFSLFLFTFLSSVAEVMMKMKAVIAIAAKKKKKKEEEEEEEEE